MKCEYCGEDFSPVTKHQRFCCHQCCQRFHSKVRNPVAVKIDTPPTETVKVKRIKVDTTPTETETLKKDLANLLREAVKCSTPPKKKTPTKKLGDWLREAAECHLDYGTYRALISSGKTFDELKQTFGRQDLPAHSKGAAHNHFTGGNII